MKVIFLVLCFFSLVALLSATVWHVNNIPRIIVDFISLTDAVSCIDVLNGDTLYVYGSPTSYGTITISKVLTIIGPGYFLNENEGLQQNISSAYIDVITLNTGAMGSVISGIKIGTLSVNCNDAIIQRNYINTINITYTANCIIMQNYIEQGSNAVNMSSAVNYILANNYIGWTPGYRAMQIYYASSGLIYNNIINGTCSIRNAEMYNNIFIGIGNQGWYNWDYVSSCSIHHNIFGSVQYFDWTGRITGEDNQINVSAQVFLNTGTSDGRFQLCEGSPAISAGMNNVDCGIYGRLAPYKLSGIPTIPTIYEFDAPVTGFQSLCT